MLQNSSKDLAQNVTHNPWGDSEGPWICLQVKLLEKTLESLLDSKEVKPVNLKGNQSWIFIGRADAKADAPILWPPDAKSRLIWKDPDAGKNCGQEEKGITEDEMVGWHHQLDEHKFEQALGVDDGQEAWRAADTTAWLNWTEIVIVLSCLIVFLSFCIFSLLWLNLYFGTWGSSRS